MDRVPPSNIQAEAACLGAMMLTPNAIPVVLDILMADDFYWAKHSEIFSHIVDIWSEDPDAVDATTVAARSEHGSYVHTVSEGTLTASNAKQYARIVKHLSVCRRLIDAGRSIVDIGYDDGEDLDTLMDRAEELVYSIRPQTDKNTALAKDIAHMVLSDCESGVRPNIVSTGYSELDETTGGLHGSNLIIVGARPGVGKTAVALAMSHNVSADGTVLFFSLEMSQRELLERLLCSVACVPVTALRARDLNQDQLVQLRGALPEIESRDLRVIDAPRMSIMDLKSKARQYASKANIRMIVVDYIQLLTLGYRGSSRNEEVSAISGELKALAREMDVPVIALSQLNRVSTFDGSEPDISHLRDSGALEQDADQVWLLSWPKDADFGSTGFLSVNVAKNRNGQRGKIDLVWNKRWQRLEAT